MRDAWDGHWWLIFTSWSIIIKGTETVLTDALSCVSSCSGAAFIMCTVLFSSQAWGLSLLHSVKLDWLTGPTYTTMVCMCDEEAADWMDESRILRLSVREAVCELTVSVHKLCSFWKIHWLIALCLCLLALGGNRHSGGLPFRGLSFRISEGLPRGKWRRHSRYSQNSTSCPDSIVVRVDAFQSEHWGSILSWEVNLILS